MREEPGAGEFPITLHGGDGNFKDIGDFLLREASEEAHFDYGGGPGIELFQADQGVVNFGDAAVEDDLVAASLVERDMDLAAATHRAVAAASMIHNQPAHLLSGQVEKVEAILAAHRGAGEHSDAELVDEGRGLEGIRIGLLAQVNGSKAPQLAIDGGDELAAGCIVSSPPFGKEQGEIG